VVNKPPHNNQVKPTNFVRHAACLRNRRAGTAKTAGFHRRPSLKIGGLLGRYAAWKLKKIKPKK